MGGELIGSPILDVKETALIKEKELLKEITSLSGNSYFIIRDDEKTRKCSFLGEDNKCRIQKMKPLDCLCYPIKAVYDKGKIKFIIDAECPAAKHLDKEFIKHAKRAALKSIKRFDRETYEHWLEKYIGWVGKTGVDLEEFVKKY